MNHSFEVGKTYRDHVGAYKVVAIDLNRLIYVTTDGTEHEGDAELKWRIYSYLLSETGVPQTPRSLQQRSAGGGDFYCNDEVSPIFAHVIKAYGKRHKDFMTHKKIVAAFMEHPEGQLILKRPHDRTNRYWVGVMMAWFSRTFTEGRSDWDSSFERKKIGPAWAYRKRLVR